MNKSVKLNFRVTESEEKIIRKKADKSNISVSEYVRKSALNKNIIVVSGAEKLLRELSAIGNNLNQQTVIMRNNSGYSPHLCDMKNSFCEVMTALKTSLGKENKNGDN